MGLHCLLQLKTVVRRTLWKKNEEEEEGGEENKRWNKTFRSLFRCAFPPMMEYPDKERRQEWVSTGEESSKLRDNLNVSIKK